MRIMTLFGTAVLTLFAGNALAMVQSDQIRGEVLSVDRNDRELEIRVKEVGSFLKADVGAAATYHVPANVPIDFDIERRVYRTPANFDFGDIRPGDSVVLDFDAISNWTEITRFRNEEPRDPTIRERVIAISEEVEDEVDADANFDADVDVDENDIDADFDADVDVDMDDDEMRTELPDSASSLPMFTLFGLMFAGLAFAVRLTRS